MENIVTAKELAGLLKLTGANIYKLASRGEFLGLKSGIHGDSTWTKSSN
jgi:hypothetical protein